MSIFQRVLPRFVAEGLAIVLAAVIAGVEHLVWWQVGLCVGVVLVAAIVLESALSAPAQARPATAPAAPAPLPAVETPHVRVLQDRPLAPLVPEPVPVLLEPEPEPEPAPVLVQEPEPPAPVVPAVSAPATPLTGPPWNIWELERALRESGSTDDEKSFLLHYLRDYAGPDGVLPSEFDDLVRESFGSLL